jgi:hypothetical protein
MVGLGVRMRLSSTTGQDGGLDMLVDDEIVLGPITDESCSQMCCGW